MKPSSVRIPLNGTEEQHRRLLALQAAFVQVCNALAPMVQQHRCWHRVTLHHLSYKVLRERFPAIGSQMVCNAIYSVCRTARVAFQHPDSPVNVARLNGAPLPLLRFGDNSPVYFDRHTLSVKDGKLSMYTLDGRMRFDVALSPADEERFHEEKLLEVVLARNSRGAFELAFWFTAEGESDGAAPMQHVGQQGRLPEYVKVSHE